MKPNVSLRNLAGETLRCQISPATQAFIKLFVDPAALHLHKLFVIMMYNCLCSRFTY